MVGFDQNFPPFGYVDDDGNYVGFDLDLAKEAAKRMGMKVKYQPIDWDSKDMELESGTIDCIWNGFTISGREKKYTWTDPYMDNSQVVVVKSDSGINSLADLKGKNVEVQKESSAETAINDNKELKDSFAQYTGVGFEKGNTKLRDKVEKALKEMVKDGTFQKISEKWFDGENVCILSAD